LIGYGRKLLLDNSVWARALDGRLTGAARKRFEQALADGDLWTCPPALLEIRYSAHDSRHFEKLARELDAMPHVPFDAESMTAAVTAQAELAATPGASHRVKPVDLMIASIASTHGLGVLHYDLDFDTISKHTSLHFVSVWGARRGSID
jgi:predicted nucleic acid-binding protein